MRDIVVIGAGKIGSAIAAMLAETGDYRVTLADRDAAAAAAGARYSNVEAASVDIRNEAALRALLKGRYAALSAAPFQLCLLYTSPSPRDKRQSRMPSSA